MSVAQAPQQPQPPPPAPASAPTSTQPMPQLSHQSTPLNASHSQHSQLSAHLIHSFSPDTSPTSPIDLMCDSFQAARDNQFKLKKLRKNSPYHYIHASNPNLVEFDFPTVKTLDYSFPKVNPSNGWEAAAHHHHHHSNSLQGFVTLKDLMLQKQEEDAKEMYNNRVTLGVEKKLDPAKAAAVAKLLLKQQQQQQPQPHGRRSQTSIVSSASAASTAHNAADDNGSQYGGSTTGSERYNKIQSRSLPKTPDYAQSFKPDDSDIIMTRSREGQKLRDFGYEFISGDDTPGSAAAKAAARTRAGALHIAATTSQTVATAAVTGSAQKKKIVGLNWMGAAVSSEDKQIAASAAAGAAGGGSSLSSRTGSIKKTKNKLMAETLETFKTSSDKLFQFKSSHSQSTFGGQQRTGSHLSQPPEKPHKPSYLPLTLPLNKQPHKQPATHVYNMHGLPALASMPSVDESNGASGSRQAAGMKKSSTYNSGADFAGITSPTPSTSSSSASSMFTKLSFGGGGGSSSSEKKSTAKEKKLLGSPRLHRALFGQGGRRESDAQSLDHEPFMPMEPKTRAIVHEHDIADIAPTQLPPPTPHRVPNMGAGGGFASPEYPNLEYPPVFEAETYSLNDPNASLTLLRRRNQPSNRSK